MNRRDWYSERRGLVDEHPVNKLATDRLHAEEKHRNDWQRILDLNGRLTDEQGGDLGDLWLELEALLNDRSLLLASEFYNIGVEHGLEMRAAGDGPVIKALAEAITRMAERL